MYRFLLPFYVFAFYAVFAIVKIFTWLGIPRRRRVDKIRSVLFLESMGPPSGGFRFRSNAWAEMLSHQGVHADVWVAVDYQKQLRLKRTRSGMMRLHLIYLFKRFVQCYHSVRYDAVIVRREILLYNDYGNLFFEKWMRRIHHNLILDVDDDISAAKHEPRDVSFFGKVMQEDPEKFTASLSIYTKVIVASKYLKERFQLNDSNTLVLPTCLNTSVCKRKVHNQTRSKIVIGWIGSSNNFSDLFVANSALKRLSDEGQIDILIVSDAKPVNASFPFVFVPWSLDKEQENLLQMDIGIMPVRNDAEGRGKGGLKLIQYMAHGIVSVASAITVNKEIVEDCVNGFLVQSEDDWYKTIKHAMTLQQQFSQIGNAAAVHINAHYSHQSQFKMFSDFIDVAVSTGTISNSPIQHAVK